ncbi:MAG TPA: protein kinase [Hyphomonadaceae bacterium]|nr:protein kinase [Hyphomonadaceae bacterium]
MSGDNSGEAKDGKAPDQQGFQITYTDADLERLGRAPGLMRRLSKGDTVAKRFVIEELLGQGGTGAVYSASDTYTRQTVALKLIRPDRVPTAEKREKLFSEAATARGIRHKNVVAVYDAGLTDSNEPFITMEKVEGRLLRSWLQEQVANPENCPLDVAAAIIFGILDGLEAAHELNIIHRDLKPENVFLIGEPKPEVARVKILDFGLATVANSATDRTSSLGVGTAWYMAPEQETAPNAVTVAADFYALSVIFYELLVGARPVSQLDRVRQQRTDIPSAVDDLIYLGLSKNWRLRPNSVTKYRHLLQAAIDTPEARKAREDRKLEAQGPAAMLKRAGELFAQSRSSSGAEAGALFEESLAWMTKAAEGGEVDAMLQLGRLRSWPAAKDLGESSVNRRLWVWEIVGGNRDAAAERSDELKHEISASSFAACLDLAAARFWFDRAAQAGNAGAKYHLAELMITGEGGPADFYGARKLLSQIADGDPLAAYPLAFMQRHGLGGPVDAAGARALFGVWTVKGFETAAEHLCNMLWKGEGGPADPHRAHEVAVPQAHRWVTIRQLQNVFGGVTSPEGLAELREILFLLAADKIKGSQGYRWLADMQAKGQGGPVEATRAIASLRKAAERGDKSALEEISALETRAQQEAAVAARNEALSLFDGDKVRADPAKARKLFETAAKLGDVSSMSNLGWMMERGEGGPKDYAAARDWYRKAAEGGFVAGMFNYANYLRDGTGGSKDLNAARAWYKKAADNGDKDAAAALAEMDAPLSPTKLAEMRRRADALYKQGKGTAAEIAEAVKLYVEAGEAGDIDAMNALGRMARWGEGVQRNSDSAKVWFRKAAELGDPYAMYMLGWMLKNGESNDGWKYDTEGAVRWLTKASDAGEVRATTMLGDMLTGERQFKLYHKAAEGGWVGAMIKLGKLLLTGAAGVPADKNAARAWIAKAAATGDSEAVKLLKEKF